MKKIKVKKLTKEAFEPYGSYATLIDPVEPVTGDSNVFTPDLALLNLSPGNTVASFSVCVAKKREFIIKDMEYHDYTGEGILPLNGDVIVHVSIAFSDLDRGCEYVECFYVPQGCVLTLKPGVWHHAPFGVDKNVSTLILLPPRTYQVDCECFELKEKNQVEFEL